MKQHRKTRHAASKAVIALRKALGKTQQAFAHEVVKGSIVTVARWETSLPPHGETLLQLAHIAREHRVDYLEWEFLELYLQDVQRKLGNSLIFFPARVGRRARAWIKTKSEHAWLLMHLEGADQIKAALEFVRRVKQIPRSTETISAIVNLDDLREGGPGLPPEIVLPMLETLRKKDSDKR